MKYFQVIRRFFRKEEGVVFSNVVYTSNNLIKIVDFMNNEKELLDNNILHIDTYVVCFQLNTEYNNILKEDDIIRNSFNSFLVSC